MSKIGSYTAEIFNALELVEALNKQGFDIDLLDLVYEPNNDSIIRTWVEYDDENLVKAIEELTGISAPDEIFLEISW